MAAARDMAMAAKAWPFEEARKLLDRLGDAAPEKGHVLFETGYGPSGLPHIGTFGEVARTTMVRRAFAELSDVPTRLLAFSDDMDGLRKVPDNVPNREMLAGHLGRPLTAVPDPFGTHDSFGAHNNARLRAFLDRFGVAYEFASATEYYRAGRFDATLLRLLERYDETIAVILPTLGPERRETYSPFLPVCPTTGIVLQVPLVERRPRSGTVVYRDPRSGALVEVPVTGGHCKLQWKADWAMRWVALDVDYEMSGKDLIDSVRLSSRICRILGGTPPEGFTYELFLDQNGEKISKSRGNGLTIDEWLEYGPAASLGWFMYGKPKAAKRLHFDVIPRHVDEWLGGLARFAGEDAAAQLENPAWHVHAGTPPAAEDGPSFGVLLNLASVCNTEDAALLWAFVARYMPDASPATHPLLDALVGHAIACYRDLVKPAKRYRAPSPAERAALADLADRIAALPQGTDGETVQAEVYAVGKAHAFEPLRDWFRCLYEVLLGQSEGPRFGSFAAIYGIAETVTLIRRALAGEDLSAA